MINMYQKSLRLGPVSIVLPPKWASDVVSIPQGSSWPSQASPHGEGLKNALHIRPVGLQATNNKRSLLSGSSSNKQQLDASANVTCEECMLL